MTNHTNRKEAEAAERAVVVTTQDRTGIACSFLCRLPKPLLPMTSVTDDMPLRLERW